MPSPRAYTECYINTTFDIISPNRDTDTDTVPFPSIRVIRRGETFAVCTLPVFFSRPPAGGLPGQAKTRGNSPAWRREGKGERYHAPFRKECWDIIKLYASAWVITIFPAVEPQIEPFPVRRLLRTERYRWLPVPVLTFWADIFRNTDTWYAEPLFIYAGH